MNAYFPTTEPVATAAAETVAVLRKEYSVVGGELDETSNAPLFADLKAVAELAEPLADVRSNLLGLALSGIRVSWAAMDDHLAAMESDLRRRPHAIWSTMTLARAVQESVIFAQYLAKPGLSTDERLVRIAETWLADATNRVNASPDILGPEGVNFRTNAIEGRNFCIDELRRGGFTIDVSSTGVPRSITLGTFTIRKIGFSTTDEAKSLMPPGAPETYRLASAAAHSRPWYLTKNAIMDAQGVWTAQSAATVTPVAIAADALRAGMQALGGFYGVDTSTAEARIHEALKNFMVFAASHNVGAPHEVGAPTAG